jgi:hypothetical protein
MVCSDYLLKCKELESVVVQIVNECGGGIKMEDLAAKIYALGYDSDEFDSEALWDIVSNTGVLHMLTYGDTKLSPGSLFVFRTRKHGEYDVTT